MNGFDLIFLKSIEMINNWVKFYNYKNKILKVVLWGKCLYICRERVCNNFCLLLCLCDELVLVGRWFN